MARYRKRPIVIDAWRWTYNADGEPEPSWVRDALAKWPAVGGLAFEPEHPDGPRMCVATLDAVAVLSPGDWLCRGVLGELYPCKPDIFDATYEPVVTNIEGALSKPEVA